MTDEPQDYDLLSTFKRIAQEKGFDIEKEMADAEVILAMTAALSISGDIDAVYTSPGFRYAVYSMVSMALHDEKYSPVVEAFGKDKSLADFLMMLVIDAAQLGISMGIIATTVMREHGADTPGKN